MGRGQWKGIYGDAPESFHARIEEALSRTKETRPGGRRVKLLPAAAVVIVLMAGAALAAGMRMADFLNERGGALLPEARELAQTDVGAVENEYLKMTVEEALYDGHSVLVQLLITPKNPEQYVLFNVEYGEDRRGEFFIYEYDEEKDIRRAVGSADGRKLLQYDVSMSLIRGGEGMRLSYWDVEADIDEAGSSRVWYFGYSESALKDEIRLNTTLRWGALGEYGEMPGWEYMSYVPLPEYDEFRMDLTCRAERVTMRMEPVGGSEKGVMQVNGGRITFTPVMSYYSVECEWEGRTAAHVIALEDAEGNQLEWMPVGGVSCIRAFDSVPGTLYVTVIDRAAGRNEPMDRVKVRLVKEE